MIRISQLVLLLCSLTLLSALNPSLSKKYFFVSPDNHFSQELFQTRHGIISHNIVGNQTNSSQYTLIDVSSREATSILAKVVSACEFAAPVFQHVHYHVQTDSLVYFCPQNASLLVIDQSSYTVQASIPFNIDNSFPIAKLSTDGQNIAILCMDTLYNEAAFPKSTFLLKVDMQIQKIVAEIQITTADPVVAFASTKTAAYIATNHYQYNSLITTVYSLVTIGNTYQALQLNSWRSLADFKTKVVTKLFCVGNYIITNNGAEIYLLNQQGGRTQTIPVSIKSITGDQNGLFQASMTAQYNSNDFYFVNQTSAYKYEMTGYNINSKQIGSYGDMQVAYGNLTSQDLMFAFDTSRTYFNIIDLQTLQTIYKAPSNYTDLLFTNATYSVVQALNETSSFISIFDLVNDTLITELTINKNYYYTKEQNLISFFNSTSNLCYLQHVNLTNGTTWTTWSAARICNYIINTLTLTNLGYPDLVLSLSKDYMIYNGNIGLVEWIARPKTYYDTFAFNPYAWPSTFFFYDANPSGNNITASIYGYNMLSHAFSFISKYEISDVSATNGFFPINNTKIIALSNDTLTVLTAIELTMNVKKYSTLGDWNSAKIFQDSNGTHYAILSRDGSIPVLWTDGGYFILPGLRNETIKANTAGSHSYWVADAPSSSVGLVRFYDVSGSSQGKTRISI